MIKDWDSQIKMNLLLFINPCSVSLFHHSPGTFVWLFSEPLLKYKWNWNLVMWSCFVFIFCDDTIYTMYYFSLVNLHPFSALLQLKQFSAVTDTEVGLYRVYSACKDKYASSESARRLRCEQPKPHVFSKESFCQAQSHQSDHYQYIDICSKAANRS